jgi:hypothetical protein
MRRVGRPGWSHVRIGPHLGGAVVVPPRLLQFGLMMLNPRPWVVGSNDTDRQRCTGRRKAKRPDQEFRRGVISLSSDIRPFPLFAIL